MDSSMGSNMTCVKHETVGHRVMVEPDGHVYHEKQSRELCALHALNNLCQERIFTKRDLDNICYKLSPETYINPHKSMFGLGNYDVNVIMAALQTKNLDTVWFDKRKDINGLLVENVHGLILNIPMDYKWGILHLPLRRKHWIVIRKIGRNYYNLDSKLDLPELIGSPGDLRKYLREQMECKDKELLLVVNQLVSASASWWRPLPASDPNQQEEENADNAPLAQSEDDKSQELELTIDCHIISRDVVVKPKHLKKYHQDYVPIEIHRTYHKKGTASGRNSQEFPEPGAEQAAGELAPVEVEARTVSPAEPEEYTVQGAVDGQQHPAAAMNGDLSGSGSAKGDSTPVVVVKQADDGS